MKKQTTLKRSSPGIWLFTSFLGIIIFLLALILTSLAGPVQAGPGDNLAFLPIIMKPREFETKLVSNSFAEISHITNAGDDRLFVVERNGRVRIWHPDSTITDFLDLRGQVVCCDGEEGMFALAFHPDYAVNGYFFVAYIGDNGDYHRLLVYRFQVSSDPDVADPNSAVRIFGQRLDSPLHNGGGLAFNPLNGKLYLGVGDDQGLLIAQENSDKGKIIQLDVDSYPAVYKDRVAKGLRNPWRISFDPITGDMYIAEVGDDSWEEVNFMANGVTGLNFGWPCYEGPVPNFDCAHDHTRPIYYYPHYPERAIVGGPVYREDLARKPRYIFGDFNTKKIYTLEKVGSNVDVRYEGTLPSEMTFLYTFGIGNDGTLYAGGLGGGLYEIFIPLH